MYLNVLAVDYILEHGHVLLFFLGMKRIYPKYVLGLKKGFRLKCYILYFIKIDNEIKMCRVELIYMIVFP